MKIEDYNKYYIQGSDHYLIPRDIFEELFDEMSNWRDESKQLKEVIEEASEEVKKSSLELNTREYGMLTVCNSDDLLQILDKAKDSDD